MHTIPRIIFLALLIFSCNTVLKVEPQVDSLSLIKSDTANNSFDPLLKDEFTVVNKLQLENITQGYDSFYIRLYYPKLMSRNVVVIKNNKNTWTGHIINIKYEYNNKTLGYDIAHSENNTIVPISGWSGFTEKLLKLDVSLLPDQSEIEGYSGGTDGCTYIVEFATKNKYRFYQYSDPESHKSKHQQALKFVEILDLIENEFQFKRVKCE